MKRRNVLFITWDGPQVSYLEGLFLPIFQRLRIEGFQFHVLQFTWGARDAINNRCDVCAAADVPYRHVVVMQRPRRLGQFLTATWGARHIRRAIKDWSIDLLMPRSLMPALAVLAMGARGRPPVVFDADGLPADERVDFHGLNPSGITYRLLRDIESQMLRASDVVIARTPSAIAVLKARAGASAKPPAHHLVSNGRDPNPYLGADRKIRRGALRLCYAGSIGSQYKPAHMLNVAQLLKAELPDLVFRVFTSNTQALLAEIDHLAIPDPGWIEILQLPPEAIPAALMECDLALAFREPRFSMAGVAPIKIGEYLLAGLPIIGTAGIGPVEALIEKGVFLPIDDDLSTVWPWVRDHVLPQREAVAATAHGLGLEHFSLESTVKQYAVALADCSIRGQTS